MPRKQGRNKERKKPMNVKNYKTIICIAAAVALLGAAVFCGFKIYSHYHQIDEQTEAFAEIAEVVENAEPEEEPSRDKDTPVSEGEDILAKYKELYSVGFLLTEQPSTILSCRAKITRISI